MLGVPLELLQAHTHTDPRFCCWKKHIQELINKHDWNNQCFSTSGTLSPEHNREPVRSSSIKACLPRAPRPFHGLQDSAQYSRD